MSITLSDGTVTLALPPDLEWVDELAWSPLVQKADYSITGAVLVQQATRVQGRPVTLTGGDGFAWISRATLDALKTWEATPGKTLTLTIRGASRSVIFRAHEPPAVDGAPIVPFNSPDATDFYAVTIRLMEI